MTSRTKQVFGYLWAIFSGFVFLTAVKSLSVAGPVEAIVIGYIIAFGYVILRWNLVAGNVTIKSIWLLGSLRGFVLLCAFLMFAGVSGFHGFSEEGKMFAALVALFMAIEAGWQFKRLAIQPSQKEGPQ